MKSKFDGVDMAWMILGGFILGFIAALALVGVIDVSLR